jgi:hypothetical protein
MKYPVIQKNPGCGKDKKQQRRFIRRPFKLTFLFHRFWVEVAGIGICWAGISFTSSKDGNYCLLSIASRKLQLSFQIAIIQGRKTGGLQNKRNVIMLFCSFLSVVLPIKNLTRIFIPPQIQISFFHTRHPFLLEVPYKPQSNCFAIACSWKLAVRRK